MFKKKMILDKENMDMAEHLIPYIYQEALKKEKITGLLIWDMEYEEAAAVILLTVEADWMEILWVAVDEMYRGEHLAECLIRETLADAKEAGHVKGAFAQFSKADNNKYIYQILQDLEFQMEDEETDIYECTVEELLKSEELRKISDFSHTMQLKDASDKMKHILLKAIQEDAKAVPLPEKPVWEDYDGMLSVLYGTEEHVSAVALAKKSKTGILYLDCVWGAAPKAVIYVLAAALAKVVALYPADTIVVIPAITDISRQLVLKLIPDVKADLETRAKLIF